jgi:hypothetical protein
LNFFLIFFQAREFARACNDSIDGESIIAAATSVKAGIDEGHALLQVDRLHVARDASERALRDRERARDDCVIAIDNFQHESTKCDAASAARERAEAARERAEAARQRAEAARQRAEVLVTFALEEWKLVTTNATNDVTAADKLTAANRDLNAADDKLTAANRDLNAADDKLAAANRDLSAAGDSRLTAKSELTSANRKLADADRELAKANHNLSMAVAAADNSLEAAAGEHLRCLNAAMTTLSSAVDCARKDVGNENPESLMHTLVCELDVAAASAYATKQNIIESLHLKSTSTNQYVLIAQRCAVRVAELVRDCTVAKRAHRLLVEALRASGGDSEAFATQNMLVAVCDKYLTAECAERPEGTQFVRGRDFVAGALAALTDRITADARLNEATIWVHNNPLFTNAFLRCGATLEESWVTLEAESADTGTVHPRTAQIIDVVVALGGKKVMATTAPSFHATVQKCCNRVQATAVANMRGASDTSYFFNVAIVDFKITVTCTILLYWLVLLEVPIISIDLNKPHTYVELFDYLRVVVGMTEVMQSTEWLALRQLGGDGSGGPVAGNGGHDRRDDRDDNGGGGDGSGRRVRLKGDGSLAPSAQSPNVNYTPSHRAMAIEGEIVSSKEHHNDGSAAYVFLGAERVCKAYSASPSSPLAVQAANEVHTHQLLALRAPSSVMPLLDVAMGVSFRSPRNRDVMCNYAAVVITTPRADGAAVDWSKLDGGQLAVRGEQMLFALSDLAACGAVHNDIKPDNLVVHGGIVRMIDFGRSAVCDVFTGCSPYVQPGGTPGFMAPEVEHAWMRGRMMVLTQAVDIFSAGRVLGMASHLVECCAPLRLLVERMTSAESSERPSARVALAEWRDVVAPALVARPVATEAEQQTAAAASVDGAVVVVCSAAPMSMSVAAASRAPELRDPSRDPLRAPGDPLRAPGDPLRAPGDPLRAPGDPLRAPGDPLRAPGDPLRAPGDPLQCELQPRAQQRAKRTPVPRIHNVRDFSAASGAKQQLCQVDKENQY